MKRSSVIPLRWRRWFPAKKQITSCECLGPIGKRQAGAGVELRRMLRGVGRLSAEQRAHLQREAARR